MLKALLVPVLAAGLALGGTAKQAEALTAEEAAAILAGLAIVGVIASSNNNKNNNNNRSSASKRSAPHYDRKDSERREHRNVLPAQCVRRFDTDRGIRNLAIERCLQRNGVRTARLPDRCEVRVRTDRGTRDAYRQRCLEREGYRFRDTDRRRDGRVVLDARR